MAKEKSGSERPGPEHKEESGAPAKEKAKARTVTVHYMANGPVVMKRTVDVVDTHGPDEVTVRMAPNSLLRVRRGPKEFYPFFTR